MRYALLSFASVLVTVGLLVAMAWAIEDHDRVAPFNRFAAAYNDFVAIDPRVMDLKALKRMRAEWRALVKSQGWPAEEKPCY